MDRHRFTDVQRLISCLQLVNDSAFEGNGRAFDDWGGFTSSDGTCLDPVKYQGESPIRRLICDTLSRRRELAVENVGSLDPSWAKVTPVRTSRHVGSYPGTLARGIGRALESSAQRSAPNETLSLLAFDRISTIHGGEKVETAEASRQSDRITRILVGFSPGLPGASSGNSRT